MENVTIRLSNEKLWSRFHRIGNEMIITKVGRKMFPKLEYDIEGLDPHAHYSIVMHLERVDDFRYKYVGGQWEQGSGGDFPLPAQPIRAGDDEGAFCTGEQWQQRAVAFDRFKMTNSATLSQDERISGKIHIPSMHKYVPVVYIYEVTVEPMTLNHAYSLVKKYRTDLAEFIAVTAYQNDAITKLKIECNPFAKGFRDTDRKRSFSPLSDEGSPRTKRSTPPQGLMAEPKDHSPTVTMPFIPSDDRQSTAAWQQAFAGMPQMSSMTAAQSAFMGHMGPMGQYPAAAAAAMSHQYYPYYNAYWNMPQMSGWPGYQTGAGTVPSTTTSTSEHPRAMFPQPMTQLQYPAACNWYSAQDLNGLLPKEERQTEITHL